MTWTIPADTDYEIRRGDKGIAVWALQRLIGGGFLVADGDFGARTERSLREFQKAKHLVVDGVAGPATQRAAVDVVLARVTRLVPPGLLAGFVDGEGGAAPIGAVNWSTSGPGNPNPGIDCGAFQRRVYQADYHNDAVIERAFDVARQAQMLDDSLVNLHAMFLGRPGTRDGYGGVRPSEKAWRLAALNHNYPAAADYLSWTPISRVGSYWKTPAAWMKVVRLANGTMDYLSFPDGTKVRTPLEWCQNYAGVLGYYHGSTGMVTRRVTSFP
jgi:hypothetical protein